MSVLQYLVQYHADSLQYGTGTVLVPEVATFKTVNCPVGRINKSTQPMTSLTAHASSSATQNAANLKSGREHQRASLFQSLQFSNLIKKSKGYRYNAMYKRKIETDDDLLIQATCKLQRERVQELIRAGANPNYYADRTMKTALHHACMRGALEMVHCLTENKGTNLNAKDYCGWTPLHLASFRSRFEIAQVLLENGSEVNVLAKHGSTPLHLSINKSDINMTRLLIEKGANVNVKYKASGTDSIPTPLRSAVKANCLDVAKLLIENGAIVSLKDGVENRTPLHDACDDDRLEITRLLIEHGADLHAKDKNGWSPLHFASNRCDLDTAKVLVENGANLESADNNGATPLHLLCSKDSDLKVVQFLCENGTAIHAKDNKGWTPLHQACYSGKLEIVKLLLGHGANGRLRSNCGLTPLHIASQANHQDIVWFLVRQCPWLVTER